MRKTLLTIGVIIYWLLAAKLPGQTNNEVQQFQPLFNQAETLFNGAATDSTDSAALNYYSRIVAGLHPNATNAALLYKCYERAGILKQGLGYTPEAILQDYYAALQVQTTFHLSDSIVFRLLLSAGNVHYTKGLLDSSVYYFSRAEKILNRYPAAGLAGDLYNSLGVLYNEAGNYVQSGVYFSKALELTRQQHPELGEAIFAMSANIASAVRSSGKPDSALQLYKQLLNTSRPSLAIINNISEIYLIKNQPDSALHYLQLIKDISGYYAIAIHNTFAQAYMLKGDTTQAVTHLEVATGLHQTGTGQIKSNYYGATQKCLGDLRVMEGKPQLALQHYQQSIIQYNFKFNDSNAYSNPGNFVGDFASYNLFSALTAKAGCFATLYSGTKEPQYLKAAVSTYDSAFVLSDYIKKSIDNDEARLFIADKVFDAYGKAVDFLMNNTTENNEDKIAHILQWISKSRATSLAISLKENTIKQYAGLPDTLLQKEENYKINISRLKLQLQQSTDTAAQTRLLSVINTATLQLQTIDNTLKEFPNYYRQKFAADSLDVKAIQQKVMDEYTAAICYFKGTGKLYAFVIKQQAIASYIISGNAALDNNIEAYTRQLTASSAGKAYDKTTAMYLYNKLMQPLISDLQGITSLIVIPDQDLINVPFEAFQPDANTYLIQDYTITYQYALPFLQKEKISFNKKNAVAFAPFAGNNKYATMQVLPSSLNEIAQFSKAAQIVNNAATKNKFIAEAAGASVIHLATHAAVNYQEPENSFIAFYKQNKNDSGYKMFAHELYNLQLPHTQFVFLSACETGSGKVSRSEGALSISRAFAFAGCPNIVTSLWKAEDKSTAYISKHFYQYVDKGYAYARALQQAKKDLLADVSMSQFHAPVYWSHLIFIGDVQEEQSTVWLWIVIGVIILITVLTVIFLRRKKQV